MTYATVTANGNTISCCPVVHDSSRPMVAVIASDAPDRSILILLKPESALLLGKALSEAGAYTDPLSAAWISQQREIEETLDDPFSGR